MRWLKRIGKWAGICFLALVILGAVYQQIGSALDERFAPPPGEMVAAHGAGPIIVPGSTHSSTVTGASMVMGAAQSEFLAKKIVGFAATVHGSGV
ncbi:MAG TPA: hypothetical protein VHY79_19690 [Rhizomicrobium sp.]|jgi:hypothetical protein|nr:hypothetical protein [Rhizomicrobium sp.]